MGIDHLLDRDGAGHGRAGSQKRRRGAEGKARRMPERLQRRRPDMAVAHHAIEGREMPALLFRHMLDRRTAGPLGQDRELALVDAPGAILARLIDADHPLDGLVAGWIAGKPALSGHCSPRPRTAAKRPKSPSAVA